MDYLDYLTRNPDYNIEFQDVDQMLTPAVEKERQRLKTQIQEINQEIQHRKDIHEDSMDELEAALEEYKDQLRTASWRNHDEKERLKQKRNEIQDTLRKQPEQFWRDIKDLKHERRKLRRELDELEDAWDDIF